MLTSCFFAFYTRIMKKSPAYTHLDEDEYEHIHVDTHSRAHIHTNDSLSPTHTHSHSLTPSLPHSLTPYFPFSHSLLTSLSLTHSILPFLPRYLPPSYPLTLPRSLTHTQAGTTSTMTTQTKRRGAEITGRAPRTMDLRGWGARVVGGGGQDGLTKGKVSVPQYVLSYCHLCLCMVG